MIDVGDHAPYYVPHPQQGIFAKKVESTKEVNPSH